IVESKVALEDSTRLDAPAASVPGGHRPPLLYETAQPEAATSPETVRPDVFSDELERHAPAPPIRRSDPVIGRVSPELTRQVHREPVRAQTPAVRPVTAAPLIPVSQPSNSATPVEPLQTASEMEALPVTPAETVGTHSQPSEAPVKLNRLASSPSTPQPSIRI